MKLIRKTLQYYLLVSLPLLIVAGLISYFLLKQELHDGTDESLLKELYNAKCLINSGAYSQKNFLSSDSLSYISIANGEQTGTVFSDTSIFDTNEAEFIPYRKLESFFKRKENNYKICLLKTTIEEDELLEGIFSIFSIIIAFLVIAFFAANWLLSKTLWKPFYKTVNTLNSFDLKNYNNPVFTKEKIQEFNQLNEALNKMTQKIHDDYTQQKEFIENASHEMQTPVAILRANVSLLFQSENLKEQEMEQLQVIENTIKKLGTLNKALLLLSKIENNQFENNSPTNIKQLIEKAIETFEVPIQTKKLNLSITIKSELILIINSSLAEILINNLLQNAIRHNYEGGEVQITIYKNMLEIANTGLPLTINATELFMRFKKNNETKDSLGLGLSIVASILKKYNYPITYSYKNPYHHFLITF